VADPVGRAITGETRVAGVVGWPARHSLSPAIHNAAFSATGLDWVYVAFEVPDGHGAGAVEAMRTLGLGGLSVTMPHKGSVHDAVEDRTPVAADLGAVNCVFRRGDLLVGDNTDGAGFLDALQIDEGVTTAGRRCVVVGAGGAGRAVVRALAGAGAAEVVVVNRSPAPAQRAAVLAGACGRVGGGADVASADLVVNATPIGMDGTGPSDGERASLPLDPGLLHAGQVVVDLIYHPETTPLLSAARERGATAVNGLGMLVHQAAHAFRRWTGEEAPLAQMRDATRRELARRAQFDRGP
jgi:shikimate dehydrogenase